MAVASLNTDIPFSVIRADYCQGAQIYPEHSRGKQCMANGLIFLIHFLFKDVENADKADLHAILDTGDVLYRSLEKTNDLLLVSDLPKGILINHQYISSKVLKTYAGIMVAGYESEVGYSLEVALAFASERTSSFLVVFHASAIAIQFQNGRFYVFDSHSRGVNAMCVPEGTCVLSIIPNLSVLCGYLRELCSSLSQNPLDNVQFEIHAIRTKQVKYKPRLVNTTHIYCYEQYVAFHRESFSPVLSTRETQVDNTGYSTECEGFRPRVRKRKANAPCLEFEVNCKKHKEAKSATCKSRNRNVNNVNDLCVKQNVHVPSSSKDMSHTNIIAHFKEKVAEGPIYICTCCTQTWFSNHVCDTSKTKAAQSDFAQSCFNGIKSKNECEWVCETCLSSIRDNRIPTCAIRNGMGFPTKPKELDITEMEERLISPRIPFMQLSEKPRGGQRSLRGNVVNVPTDVDSTVKCLPRTLADTETIQVKLKRRLSNKHTVMYESIRPNKCIDALRWLLEHSTVFQAEGISLNENWQISDQKEYYDFSEEETNITNRNENLQQCSDISANYNRKPSLTDSELINNDKKIDKIPEQLNTDLQSDGDSDGWTEVKQFEDRVTGNTDTLLNPSDMRSMTKTLSFAPGEGQTPLGLYQDKDAEYLAFPTIYCGQRRPENKNRKTPVHYSTICKWELRCFDRRAACSIPNLFFKMKKLQIKQIQDKVNLAMRKCKVQNRQVTAADVLNPASFDNVVKLNEGYRVLRTLRGSPAYWEQAKKDIFAMIRQLGIPTWFCSLSAAETRWLSLLRVLVKLVRKREYSDEELNALTWMEKCELIKSDPVTCARYFQHRVQIFISTVLKGDMEPLGKIQDYFYRVEFQQRGSPHIHMLIWIQNAPKYGEDSNEDVERFIDHHTTCSKESERPDLINYQTHRHARTCRKKGKALCRFGFPLLPMQKTKILEPLLDLEYDANPKADANYVKICEMLNAMTMGEDISFHEFLEKLQMTDEMYINAIRSSLKSPKIFLKRSPSEVRINSHNRLLLESWEANIDVQYILDAYACAAYIVSYISKGQRGMSNLLYQACRDVQKGNISLKQQVRHIGNKFLTHVEICAQEAAYLVLQMPLRMTSRSIIFINTSESSERTLLLKPIHILEEMPQNSTNIESDNHTKRYQRRPRDLRNCCLADFYSKFDAILPKKKAKSTKEASDGHLLENLEDIDDDSFSPDHEKRCIEQSQDENVDQLLADSNTNGAFESEYQMRDGTILRKRKTQKVLRYVRFSKVHDAENYYREQLMLFLPWHKESDLLGQFVSYNESFQYHLDIVEYNKRGYEGNGANVVEMVEDQLDTLANAQIVAPETQHNEEKDLDEDSSESPLYGCFDPTEHQQNYDLAIDLGITRKAIDKEEVYLNDMSNEDYMKIARSLNSQQSIFFNHVLHWFKTNLSPIHCFLTGGAGVGKSVLTTALYQAVTRFLNKRLTDCPDEIKAVLCAPTGKAAHNIGGSTIHSLFCIPANQGFKYKALDSQQLDTMRVKFRSLKVVFIDEISMVGNKMFNFINRRLQEIFASDLPFGGVSVIAIGDLYQLKPVMDGWIFADLREDFGPLAANLWKEHFLMFELTEIMRQKDDVDFAEMLNRLREGHHTPEDIQCLKEQVVVSESLRLTSKPHLFTTNAEVNGHNKAAYQNAHEHRKCSIQAIDTVDGDLPQTVKARILDQVPDNPVNTMGLFTNLCIVEELPADICVNVDVDDGLTNGTPGIVKHLDFRVQYSERCSIIWVLFEENVGAKTRQKYAHLYTEFIDKKWTPILEITRKFGVGRNRGCFVTRRQFPLRLAAAKTIHKSQGSTMDTAVLHFGNRKQEHMHYVGLSRIRKLQDVHILKLGEDKIAVSEAVSQEMTRLRLEGCLNSCIPILSNISTDLKIIYHNSRSLHLHIRDLVADGNMLAADIIAISETRLQGTDPDHKYLLPGFRMFRADDQTCLDYRSYKGMILYSKWELEDITTCVMFGIESISATIVHQQLKAPVHLVFIYNPPRNATATSLIKFLDKIMQRSRAYIDMPIVVMGDTNIDFIQQSNCGNLLSFLQLQQINQLMHSVTTDYGSCLDQIYMKNMAEDEISCATLESYYSDHKPIVAYLPYQ